MTTEPFKPGEKVWVGDWSAGIYNRIEQATVICHYGQMIALMLDGMWQFSPIENLERIHDDLNERLK